MLQLLKIIKKIVTKINRLLVNSFISSSVNKNVCTIHMIATGSLHGR